MYKELCKRYKKEGWKVETELGDTDDSLVGSYNYFILSILIQLSPPSLQPLRSKLLFQFRKLFGLLLKLFLTNNNSSVSIILMINC